MTPFRIAVLISGGGTTLRNLLERIAAGRLPVEIALVISSSPTARGLQFAAEAGIPSEVIARRRLPTRTSSAGPMFDRCRQAGVDLVVMGGFLKRLTIPDGFRQPRDQHPSRAGSRLLRRRVLWPSCPRGGAGIRGQAERLHGPLRRQPVRPRAGDPAAGGAGLDDDTPETLAARVFEAECEAYPEAMRLIAAGRVTVEGRRVRIKPE